MHGVGEIRKMNKNDPAEAYRVQRDIFRAALVRLKKRVPEDVIKFIDVELERGDKKGATNA